MKPIPDLLDKLVRQLEVEALQTEDPGLLYGKMGIAIFFFKYARSSANACYEDFAMQIIESVLANINEATPVTYASGLAGIGTGIVHLIQEGFIQADSNEVLQEIDDTMIRVVHLRLVHSADIETGVCGIGRYFVYRLRGQSAEIDCWRIVLIKEHLIYLIDWLEELIPESTAYLNDIQELLLEILPLGIYRTKVEKLLEYCMGKLQEIHPGIKNGKAGIGISLLTTSVPW